MSETLAEMRRQVEAALAEVWEQSRQPAWEEHLS
jgi:hypothetical protein